MGFSFEPVTQILQGPDAEARTDRSAHADRSSPGSSLGFRLGLTLLAGMLYGAALGSFGCLVGDRFWQIAISGLKVPLLLLTTFALSLPSFFVVNTLMGLRADFPAVLRALTSGQAGLTIVLASLAPFTLLIYASTDSYGVAQLFNALMFGVATLTAQFMVARWYRPLVAANTRHKVLLRIWLVLYSFVGIQMAWVLRPFIGSPESAIQFFREDSWGNAYVIFARMIWEALTR